MASLKEAALKKARQLEARNQRLATMGGTKKKGPPPTRPKKKLKPLTKRQKAGITTPFQRFAQLIFRD